jgi:glycosyltransferase EpsD
MVKILYVTTISNMVNAFLIPHIKFLIEQGNEVGVAFNPIQEINPELKILGCQIYHVPFQRDPFKRKNILAYKQLKKIVSEEGYQLVHVHSPVASLITRLACRKLSGVKVLYTAHGFHFFRGAPRKNWVIYYTLEKLAARWTDVVITMNEEDYFWAKKLKLRNNNQLYKVHGVGLNLNRFKPKKEEEKSKLREEYMYSKEDFLIIYVGELCYRKHQDLLIKAVSKAKKNISNLKLLLVGDGNQRDTYKALVHSLGLEKTVEFLGFRHDIDKLMNLSDLTVSTSRQEGLPVNVMEGMASGLPLIVTNCRGNNDLVKDGVNGFVIGIDDAEACANAIERLYNSQDLRVEFANKNLEIIRAYSLESVIEEMKVIYSEIMLANNTHLSERGQSDSLEQHQKRKIN